MRPEALEREAEALEAALARARHGALVGRAPAPGPAEVGVEHASLFERAPTLEALAAARRPGAGARERLLAAWLVRGHAERALAPLEASLEALQEGLRVQVGDQAVPYGELVARVAREPGRDARRLLARAQIAALDGALNPVLRERLEGHRGLARELGFADPARLAEATKGVRLEALAQEAQALLRGTDTLYRWHMDGFLGRSVSLALAVAEWHDLAHALAVPWFDDQFPAGAGPRDLDLAVAALGPVRLERAAALPPSQPALALALEVPGDVRLLHAPAAGLGACRALFHEAGHALFLAHVAPGLPPQAGRLADPSVAEAFALLLEGLLAEPAWAAERIAEPLREAYVWQQRVRRLLRVRQQAARLRYELEAWTRGPDAAPQAHRRAMERGLVVAPAPEAWLAELGEPFASADALRAEALASGLRAKLRAEFGDAWWREPGAGAWLRALWGQGGMRSAEEAASSVGQSPSLEPLRRELVDALRQEPRDYRVLPRF